MVVHKAGWQSHHCTWQEKQAHRSTPTNGAIHSFISTRCLHCLHDDWRPVSAAIAEFQWFCYELRGKLSLRRVPEFLKTSIKNWNWKTHSWLPQKTSGDTSIYFIHLNASDQFLQFVQFAGAQGQTPHPSICTWEAGGTRYDEFFWVWEDTKMAKMASELCLENDVLNS